MYYGGVLQEGDKNMMHGSLFSGIGGFDLAAQWMGWNNVFHCEINPFGRRILSYYWPNAISYGDITTTDFSLHTGKIDILSGGFPCQPYSIAGKRKGKEDHRDLWPAMFTTIKTIQPRWVVGENVRGIINWSRGLVFDEIQTQMEVEGYEVFSFVLPACSVQAPHQRDRTWIIAYKGSPENRINSNTSNERFQQCSQNGKFGILEKERKSIWSSFTGIHSKIKWWEIFPAISPFCTGSNGLSGKLDGITFPKWRIESIKGGGNAVVPQLVYRIFKIIEAFDNPELNSQ